VQKDDSEELILLLDDELSSVMWMMDYLYSKDYSVHTASNANDAYDMVRKENYRAVIIDLNVPITPPLDQVAADLDPVYLKFPGLLVAREARTRGHRDRQVIIYSVHREAEVRAISEKLRCTYIIKGRPIEIKEELDAVFSFKP
jgi:CheY-like chemotaxis protein